MRARLPILFVCLSVSSSMLAGDDPPQQAALRDVLMARSDALADFRGEISIVSSMGTERPQLVEARKLHAAWVAKNHPELSPPNQRGPENFDRLLQSPTVTRHLRYAADASGRIRVETIPLAEADSAGSDVVALSVFSGKEWKNYFESSDQRSGGRAGGLTIHSTERTNDNWHEIARGAGVAWNHRFEGSLKFDMSARATGARSLTWKELLRNVPPERTREETSVPPEGTDPKPSLILETSPFGETGHGLYRLQVWFAPEQGFAPLALLASDLQPSGGKNWDYFPNYAAKWSEPQDAAAGLSFYRKCHIRFYEQFRTVTDGVPMKEWPHKAYDFLRFDYEFSTVEIGKPLDSSLFEIAPVAGTNVIDEPKGYLYVVGEAGEELHKTALSERQRRPPDRGNGTAFSWRSVLMIANVICLIAAVIYWFVLRRRRSENKL